MIILLRSETCVRRRLHPSGGRDLRVNFGQSLASVSAATSELRGDCVGDFRFKETWKAKRNVVRDPQWARSFKHCHQDVEKALQAFTPLIQRWTKLMPAALDQNDLGPLSRGQQDAVWKTCEKVSTKLGVMTVSNFERMSLLVAFSGWDIEYIPWT